MPPALVDAARAHLETVDAEVRPGHAAGSATAVEAVERLAADIADFRDRHGLDRVVVVDVASTQPPVAGP